MRQLLINFLEKRNIEYTEVGTDLRIRSKSTKRLGQVIDRLQRDGIGYSSTAGEIHVQF